jgi:hypothetical protein
MYVDVLEWPLSLSTNIHTHKHTHTQTSLQQLVYSCALHLSACTHTHTHMNTHTLIYIYTPLQQLLDCCRVQPLRPSACMYVCIYIYIYIYIYILYTHIHTLAQQLVNRFNGLLYQRMTGKPLKRVSVILQVEVRAYLSVCVQILCTYNTLMRMLDLMRACARYVCLSPCAYINM